MDSFLELKNRSNGKMSIKEDEMYKLPADILNSMHRSVMNFVRQYKKRPIRIRLNEIGYHIFLKKLRKIYPGHFEEDDMLIHYGEIAVEAKEDGNSAKGIITIQCY